jgi:hypothetical protein
LNRFKVISFYGKKLHITPEFYEAENKSKKTHIESYNNDDDYKQKKKRMS